MKSVRVVFLLLLFATLSAMQVHKFYVSIYQVNYVPQKKRIQITARLFLDDINEALEKKYHKKITLGTANESIDDENLLKKYLAEKVIFKVNGVVKPMFFLSKEVETNTLICYCSIKEIPKISSLEIENNALMELNEDQQNIIQTSISGEKQTVLLTTENYKGTLK